MTYFILFFEVGGREGLQGWESSTCQVFGDGVSLLTKPYTDVVIVPAFLVVAACLPVPAGWYQ